MTKNALLQRIVTAALSRETPEGQEAAKQAAREHAEAARAQLRVAQAARISGYVGAGLTVASLLFGIAFLHARSRRASAE